MFSAMGLVREVAQDLTALRDPDLTLTGLVRRVRAAVGCDLAYLSLNDSETRHTEIRFTDGIRTAEYAAIRMPIGTGVLGMAAAGVTTESSDYLRDVAKLHIETVDAAVRAEGVGAIRSTPLRLGDEVVGALTIANRVPGAFQKGQRLLLEEAALIGSIAVDLYTLRHRLDQQEKASRGELAQLRLARELSQALLVGVGTPELLSIVSRAIRGRAQIGDVSSSDIEARLATRIPLDTGGILEIEPADLDETLPIMSTIATFVSISLLYEAAIEDARHLRESELAERLIDPRNENPGRALRTGLAGAGPLEIHVIQVQDPNLRRSVLRALRKGLGRAALATDHRGDLVIIGRRNSLSASQIAALTAPVRFYAGRSTATSETAIPVAFEEASLVARSMRSLGRDSELASRADLGVVAFALGNQTESAHRLVASYLTPLLSGTTRDSRLLKTALQYLDSRGSISQVATQLSIHENTVRQRLEKLDAILPGWRGGPRTLDVHVALRTHALMTSSRGQGY